jgi:hypothetical protein
MNLARPMPFVYIHVLAIAWSHMLTTDPQRELATSRGRESGREVENFGGEAR